MGRTKDLALKNQIYCEFSGSVACQVLIKQRACNLLSSEFFATFRKSTIRDSIENETYSQTDKICGGKS